MWLVRHAHSYFNMWDDWTEGRLKSSDLTPAELAFASSIVDKFDSKLVDPVLSHFGVSQAVAAQSTINTLPIKYVIVSPLQRTLETARLLFEKHPDLPRIQFVVNPMPREIMANPDDIPCFTLERMRPKYTAIKDFRFDFKMVDESRSGDLYFLETMDKPVRDQVTAEVATEGTDKYVDIMLRTMRWKWSHNPQHKKKIESFENGRRRCQDFVRWLTDEFVPQTGASLKEIMVVTHSVYLSHLVAQEFNDYGKAVCPKIPNAVPFLFDLNKVVPF